MQKMRHWLKKIFSYSATLIIDLLHGRLTISLPTLCLGLSIFSSLHLLKCLWTHSIDDCGIYSQEGWIKGKKSEEAEASTPYPLNAEWEDSSHGQPPNKECPFQCIDLNVASAEELMETLEGLSPKKARAIVDYRIKNGPFLSLEELLEVEGIGPAFIKKYAAVLKINS